MVVQRRCDLLLEGPCARDDPVGFTLDAAELVRLGDEPGGWLVEVVPGLERAARMLTGGRRPSPMRSADTVCRFRRRFRGCRAGGGAGRRRSPRSASGCRPPADAHAGARTSTRVAGPTSDTADARGAARERRRRVGRPVRPAARIAAGGSGARAGQPTCGVGGGTHGRRIPGRLAGGRLRRPRHPDRVARRRCRSRSDGTAPARRSCGSRTATPSCCRHPGARRDGSRHSRPARCSGRIRRPATSPEVVLGWHHDDAAPRRHDPSTISTRCG